MAGCRNYHQNVFYRIGKLLLVDYVQTGKCITNGSVNQMECLDNDSSDISQRTLAIEYLGLIAGRIFRHTIEEELVVSYSPNESMISEDAHGMTSITEKNNVQNLNQLHTSQEDHVVILRYLHNQITLDSIAQVSGPG